MPVLASLDRLVALVLACGKWLCLPVVTLLFLQWPLREFVGSLSREANDLGQWLFALYVAISVTAATRAKTHLAADALSRRYSERVRRNLARFGAAFGLIPWSLFVLVAGRNMVWASLVAREQFADTFNPGYFLIKLALWLLGLLMLIEGFLELFRAPAPAVRP